MALADEVKKLYTAGFNAISSMLSDAVWTHSVPSTYNSATGTVTTLDSTFTIRGFLRDMNKTESLEPNVMNEDRVFIVQGKYFPGGVVPDPKYDTLTISNVVYKIIPPVKHDATMSVVSLKLRRLV